MLFCFVYLIFFPSICSINVCWMNQSSCWRVPFSNSKCGACHCLGLPPPGMKPTVPQLLTQLQNSHGKLSLRVLPWTSPPQVQTTSWSWGCSQQGGPWCFLPRKHGLPLRRFPKPVHAPRPSLEPTLSRQLSKKKCHVHRFSTYPINWWQQRPAIITTGQTPTPTMPRPQEPWKAV